MPKQHPDVQQKIEETAQLLLQHRISDLPSETIQDELEATVQELKDPLTMTDLEWQFCTPAWCKLDPICCCTNRMYCRHRVPCGCGCGWKLKRGSMIHFRGKHFTELCALNLVLREARNARKNSDEYLKEENEQLKRQLMQITQKYSQVESVAPWVLGKVLYQGKKPEQTEVLGTFMQDTMNRIFAMNPGDVVLFGRKQP